MQRIDNAIAVRARAAGLPAQDLLCVAPTASRLAQGSRGHGTLQNVSLAIAACSFYAVAAAWRRRDHRLDAALPARQGARERVTDTTTTHY